MPSKLTAPFRRLSDLLFGYDYFVSYAHADGSDYPRTFADRLGEQGFRVFLDSRVYAAGDDLRLVTRRRIRMSKYLLVIVRAHALESRWVLTEVQRCLEAGRIPIAVNINDTLETTDQENALKRLFEDKIFVTDTVDRDKPEPSEEAVVKVVGRFKATRQDVVRIRAIAASLVVLLAAATTAGWQYLQAQQRAQRAQEQRALRYVADADRQLFQNPQQALTLSAQGLAESNTDAVEEAAAGAVRRALDVIDRRQAIQRDTNWGSNLFQSYIAGAWFEADLGARYNQDKSLLLLTTERGASGANPPGDALLLDTETLESTLLDIGPAWGSSSRGAGTIAVFRVKPGSAPAEIAFTCTEHRDSSGVLVVGDGATEVTLTAGEEDLPHWQIAGARSSYGRIAVGPNATISFKVSGGKHGLTFLDKEQMANLLERTEDGTKFGLQLRIPSRRKFKRRLEYVGFSHTQQRVYLSRQYNIEIYDLDGTFRKEISTGGGCTKYPISLVTGTLDDQLVLYGDTDGAIYRLHPHSGDCVSLGRKPGRILIKFDSNAGGDRGVMVFKNRMAALIAISDELSSRSLTYLPNESVVTALFEPGTDDRLLTAGEDGRVALWAVGTDEPQEIRVYRPAGTAIGFAAYTADGARIVAVDEEGVLLLWDASTGELLKEQSFSAL